MNKGNKKLITQIIIFIVFFSIAFFGTRMLFSVNSVDTELKKVAEEINEKCPVLIDSDTRLDSVAAFEGKIIQYNYTLLPFDKSDKSLEIEAMKSKVKIQSQENYDASVEMADFRTKEVKMKYSYYDKNGKFLFDFEVLPSNKSK